MASFSQLTKLQQDVLSRFFKHETGFFLSGGAALAAYYLKHRTTDDLDLFCLDALAFERGPFVLRQVADETGARLAIRQDAPGFKRFMLSTAIEGVVVDLVLDRVFQLSATKRNIDGVLVDSPEEIFANKLTALVGRMEERDLVDVYFLERAGLRAEDYLNAALAKDSGATPATLAWLLSEIVIPDDVKLPADVTAQELRAFILSLVQRLRVAALPSI
jgi:Nucleotidyl transferase AbiEii toxin, Type IV TA system